MIIYFCCCYQGMNQYQPFGKCIHFNIDYGDLNLLIITVVAVKVGKYVGKYLMMVAMSKILQLMGQVHQNGYL